MLLAVIPAKAGIHFALAKPQMGPGFRRDDDDDRVYGSSNSIAITTASSRPRLAG